jgi:MSHA biogenesis protein MshJ
MKREWQKLAARFDALLARERVLVLFAVIVGTALIFDALAIQPLEAKKKRMTIQLSEARQAIRLADAVVSAQGAVVDPDAVKRGYRDALRKQLAEIDRNMQGLQRGLVPPEQMARLLEEMLSRGSKLQLVSLRTLPAQRFESPAAAAASAAAAKAGAKGAKPVTRDPERTIYQHSVEVTLQGSYADLHEYLALLEKLPSQMFWGRIHVSAEQHPRLRVTLVVQTLSLNKAWLIV